VVIPRKVAITFYGPELGKAEAGCHQVFELVGVVLGLALAKGMGGQAAPFFEAPVKLADVTKLMGPEAYKAIVGYVLAQVHRDLAAGMRDEVLFAPSPIDCELLRPS